MRKKYFNVFRNKQTSTLRVLIPILLFIICLTVCALQSSIALSTENNNEEIETVIVPNEGNGVEIDLINKLKSIKLDVSFTNNIVRYFRSRRR